MKKIYSLFLSIILTSTIFSQVPDLNFTGIMDLTVPTGGSDGKAIQFTANQNIADLSIYSVSTFSNGNTSGSSLYALPSISVSVGEHILLCRDSVDLSTYFGSCWSIFDHVFQGSQPSGNGDDAVVLYENGVAIETFGVVGVDGSGESWEYLDSWAWKDTALANVGNWVYGGVNCSDGSADMQSSSCPFPLCTSSQPSTYNVTLSVNTANITVGGNGMYAGGGVLGLANAVALSDPDGDGTWTGVATFPAAGGNYVFLNSPANDQDWGAKEVLTGLSCANGQYDDRLMGALTADTTMLHCFASCETDGTCPTSPPVNPSFNDLLVGTWNLSPNAGSLGVGGSQGDVSWWSNSVGDVTLRNCLFDDSINFDSTGVFMHYMDASTWVENWQDGQGDRCATPVAPHDGLVSTTYHYDSATNVLTLNGTGAHIGVPKAVNGSELSSPANAPASVNYILTFSNNNNTLTADIQVGGGWWRFIYDKTTLPPPPPPVTYAVTMSVNTAGITVGSNGMYAGGGALGDAMAVPLSDPDGDGTWTGLATITAGTSGNYIFLNSPANGGDWGTKENLGGQPCADPNNYDDRILPNITSDTTLLHCFGSCETDGSCPVVPSTSDVTFSVDMNQYTGSQTAPYSVNINGTFNGWCGSCNTLTDADGDNVWDITLPLTAGTTIEYKFTVNGWADQEIFAGGETCTLTTGSNVNRVLSIPTNDLALGTVCFNSCSACASPSFNDLLVGTWNLSPNAGSLGVGGSQGDVSWWSNSVGDVTLRNCLFDDSINFDSTGVFMHYMDASTWVENWQDGQGDRCATPVAPHDGLVSTTYHYDSATNILTLNGTGAHIGIPKAVNGSELSSPANAPASVNYILTFSNNNNTLTADINVGGGWWRFIYDKTTLPPPPPPVTYAVTMSVNTAGITVGSNGMYAGGGALGDAMAVPLSDPDGDGTWTGLATITAGTSGNYIFLNSPANGGDWGTKENLGGQPCADPNNYDDRILPNITSDTTLLHCFGSCETDGTCPATCNAPINLGFTSFTDTSTLVHWNSGGTETVWELTYGPIGFSTGSGTIVPMLTDSSYNITGLQCNTGYDFYVKADCGFGTSTTLLSPWAGPFTFYTDSCANPISSFNDPLIGTWRLSSQAGALGVGGSQGDISWWSNSVGDISLRNCLFDDSIHFDSTGIFMHYMDGSTWVENWQDGNGDRCDVPLAPHDGLVSSTYHYDSISNVLRLNGTGAHIGIPKAVNGSELSSPAGAPAFIDYTLSFSPSGDTMTADIQVGGGWWRFIYSKTTLPPPPPPVTYNVTLSVNTATITVGANGMYAGGGVLGLANAVALSDPDGDGTWTGVATFPAAGGNYVFLNSPANDQDWGAKEVLTGLSCANGQYDDRLMGALTADTTMLHCFASCETDGTCPTSPPPATIVNVTFKVDMSQVSVSFTTPELNGTFNGWCGNCNSMSDADGDNIWDVTIPLDSGSTVEYKFSADTWSIEEMNDPNASCTNGDTVNTNRILIVPGSDITLTDVCWGSCDPCSTGIIGEALSEINIYPNPASSLLNVNSIETLNRIILRDVTGRVIIDARPTSKHYSIDVSGLSTNMYFIECFDNNRTTVKRVFVTK